MSAEESSTETTRSALWRLALGRATGDSRMSERATAQFLPVDPPAVLALVVDETIAAVFDLGRDMKKNPACIADAVLHAKSRQYPPEARAVLKAAHEVLRAADETHESWAPHSTCYPWPDGIAMPKLREHRGGQLFEELVVLLPALVDASRPLAPVVATGAAQVVTDVTLVRAQADRARFTELLRDHAGVTGAEPPGAGDGLAR